MIPGKRTYILLVIAAIASTMHSFDSLARGAEITPTRLTCEYLTDPTVVDVMQPRLSWINRATGGTRGEYQTAYEIQVASDDRMLSAGKADLWKTGRVKSRESVLVKYEGVPLVSRMDCWWRVRVWDSRGKVSRWSEPARWHMGLVSADDWTAEWIGAPWQGEDPVATQTDEPPFPAPLLRKSFTIDKEVKSARVYTTGLGYFELYCNGHKVGDDELVPNQTQWGKRENLENHGIPVHDNFTEYRVMYLCHDLTDELKRGENALGAMLGNGFYNSPSRWTLAYGTPRFIAQLEITYTDGTRQTVTTDGSWKAAPGPVVFDRVYDGEHYDARLEIPDWCDAGFDDGNWRNATRRKTPEGRLKAQMSPSDKVAKILEPVWIERLDNGSYRIDFGEEISGRVRLSGIRGKRGDSIAIKYLSESPNGANSYILSGKGDEEYAARFTWFVFRTVEITGLPEPFRSGQVVAEAVHTDVEATGSFECSNPLFNKINEIWKRSQTDNMHGGVASDCPHRERSAYTGDGQVVISTVTHNFDASAFYKKWIEDVVGAQDASTGYVPNGAPWQPGCGGGVAWGAAISVMPWEFYQAYGDRDILEYSYGGMTRHIDYMKQWLDADGIMLQQAPDRDNPLYWMNLGEWCPPGEFPPVEMVHTFYFRMCADIVARTARVLGKWDESATYDSLAHKTRDAFVKRFYDAENGTFGRCGANVFALGMGLPDPIESRVVEALKGDIEANGDHLDTGIFGTRYLFEVLCDNGLVDLACRVMNRTSFPSFGYWIAQGATTTWEQWDGGNSRNHPMFGGGLVWFYRHLAGMRAAEPGYRVIEFRPHPAGGVDWAAYSKRTPYGEASVRWDRTEGGIRVEVEVPVGSEAVVCVPSAREGVELPDRDRDRHVKYTGRADGYACYRVGSGRYVFDGDLN